MGNFSPHQRDTVTDKSQGMPVLAVGSAGFLHHGNWGPINMTQDILSIDSLVEKFGTPVYNQNHQSFGVISSYLDYGLGGVKVVRAGADTVDYKNSCKIINGDVTNGNWNNGTDQVRKINEDDETWASIETLRLEVDDASNFAVGDTAWKSGDTTTTGTISAIITVAENDGATAFIFLEYVAGTFIATDTLINSGTGSGVVAAVTEITLNGMYFAQTELIVGADEEDLVPLGAVIAQSGTIYGTVVGKNATTHTLYLSSVTGTFTAAVLTTINGITLALTPVTVATVTTTEATAQICMLYARFTGNVGNDVSVSICNSDGFDEALYIGTGSDTFKSIFDATSLTTDELAIVVMREGVVVEQHVVSTDTTALTTGGSSKFIDQYLEDNSDYIYSESVTTGTYNITDMDGTGSSTWTYKAVALTGGAAGNVTVTDLISAYTILLQKKSQAYLVGDFHDFSTETADFTTLMASLDTKIAAANGRNFAVITLRQASVDKDSFLIATAIADISGVNNRNFCPYYEWKQYTDRYTKRKYWIPCTGDNMAIHMNTILNYGDWRAPFGEVKGVMRNVTKLYHNLDEGDNTPISDLAKYGINANLYREDPVSGSSLFVAWGNRVKYDPTSDLSRINCNHALNTDLKKLRKLLAPFISEGIEQATFDAINNRCNENYLKQRSAKGAYNLIDGDGGYVWVCDNSNNTVLTQKKKEIRCYFGVKSAIAAEFIVLDVVVTSAGVDFIFV